MFDHGCCMATGPRGGFTVLYNGQVFRQSWSKAIASMTRQKRVNYSDPDLEGKDDRSDYWGRSSPQRPKGRVCTVGELVVLENLGFESGALSKGDDFLIVKRRSRCTLRRIIRNRAECDHLRDAAYTAWER